MKKNIHVYIEKKSHYSQSECCGTFLLQYIFNKTIINAICSVFVSSIQNYFQIYEHGLECRFMHLCNAICHGIHIYAIAIAIAKAFRLKLSCVRFSSKYIDFQPGVSDAMQFSSCTIVTVVQFGSFQFK